MARQKTKPVTTAAAKQPVETVVEAAAASSAGTDVPTPPPAANDTAEPPVTEPVSPVELAVQQGDAVLQGHGGGDGADTISPATEASVGEIAANAVEAGTDVPTPPPVANDTAEPPVTEPVSPVELAVQQGDAVLQGHGGGDGADTISPATQASVGEIAANAVEAVKSITETLVKVLTITVVGPAKGRWRAGRHFTPQATVIDVAELSEADVAALCADPELVVAQND